MRDFREIYHIEIIILYSIISVGILCWGRKNVKLLVSGFGWIYWCCIKIFDKLDTD